MKNPSETDISLVKLVIIPIFPILYHHIRSIDFPWQSIDIQHESMNVIPYFVYNVEKAVIVTYDILQFR